MKLNNLILVPTDFSEVCKNAIDHAVKIGEILKFDVCIYHVINKGTRQMFNDSGDVEKAVKEALEKLAGEFTANASIKVDFAWEEGSIFELIHQKAEAIGANVIILGTHGKSGMQHLFGSYALKVITRAQVPTVVVQKRPFAQIEKILLPVNTFTEARQKVSYATAIAKVFDAEIIVYKERVTDPGDMNRIEIIAKQITNAFKKSGVRYATKTSEKTGESAASLVSHAVSNNIDLIVIVTELQIGTSFFNLGPWNEKIMFNEAQIPVMCINPVEHSTVYFDF